MIADEEVMESWYGRGKLIRKREHAL